MKTLVAVYFDVQNTYVPVLHRPTIENGIKEGRHLKDDEFGGIILLVCALGSRWATERTVLLGVGDDEGKLTAQDLAQRHGLEPTGNLPESVQEDFWREGEDDEEWHSAGWKWFRQVRFGKKALYAPPNLMDLQTACVRHSRAIFRARGCADRMRVDQACDNVPERVLDSGGVPLDYRRRDTIGAGHGRAPEKDV